MKKIFIATLLFCGIGLTGFAQNDSRKELKKVNTTGVIITKENVKDQRASRKIASAPRASAVAVERANENSAVIVKRDGTPDKRYKANRHLKKNGTRDRRYKAN